MNKIFITGGSGMVGKNLINYINREDKYIVLAPTRSELDLLDLNAVTNYLKKNRPNIIIHCAGFVGGINANIERPFSFLLHNTILGFNLVNASIENSIKCLINLGSSCMYPKNSDDFLKEDDILCGKLEETNEGYALAKISVSKLCQYAKKEFGFDYKTIIPCNLFGKFDNFHPDKSHLIPAAIRKIHLAKTNNTIPIIWGDGNARREFMFTEDLASFIMYAIKNYDKLDSIMNIGIGKDYSIFEYYKTISKVLGYNGDFKFDKTKPSGMKRKLCSIKKQTKLGWKPIHNLEEGIAKTYKYYLQTYGI